MKPFSPISLETGEPSGKMPFVATHQFIDIADPLHESFIATQEKYMFAVPEQFSSATKSSLESQLTRFSALTGHVFTGMERLLALNLAAAKASAEVSLAATSQLASARDPKEFFSLIQSTPTAEKLASYSHHLTEILSATRAEFAREAQAQIIETRAKVTALVEEAAKNAPPAAGKAVAMLKSVMTNPVAGYQPSAKTAEQPAATLEAHQATATDAADKNVSDATTK